MDLKLLEDLVALARERSFVRAAEARHVTHPAFGRRIRALEAWAGVALVERGHGAPRLTEAGQALLQQGAVLLEGLAQTRQQLRRRAEAGAEVLRLGTGRTLARTLVADWLAQMSRPRQPLAGRRVDVITRSMAEVVPMLERAEIDLLFGYEHSAMSVRLSGHRFRHLVLARDRLVPVVRADARGRPEHALADGPLVAYGAALSLGALLAEHWHHGVPDAASRVRYVCDSADAIHEFVLKGLGVAWLPWSLVAADCRRRALAVLGGRSDEVHFEVRLYRPRARQPALVEALWAASLA